MLWELIKIENYTIIIINLQSYVVIYIRFYKFNGIIFIICTNSKNEN